MYILSKDYFECPVFIKQLLAQSKRAKVNVYIKTMPYCRQLIYLFKEHEQHVRHVI